MNIGLIGFGRIAQLKHLPALNKVATIAAVAERDLEQRAKLPASVALYTDYQHLLDDADVSAVVICLPSHLHAAAAVSAIERGKHVYIEKPLATTYEDGQRVIAAWQEAGTVGMVGFNFRFFPQYAQARAVIASGDIGDVVSARAIFTSRARTLPAWKQARDTGGGVLLDLATHHIDLSRYLFAAEVAAVSAETRTLTHFQDSASLTLTLTNGVNVQITAALADRERQQFEIIGTNGSLLIDRYAPALIQQPQSRRAAWQTQLKAVRFSPDYSQPFDDALGTFVRAAETGVQIAPSLADGMRSLEVVLAGEKSAETGQRINLAVPLEPFAR